ncbi:TIGR01777 family protein [Olleya aquimaris]|uniref:TIGR01777 family oxidoreductase n=1 Tax=Olleya sediminilitoris TaxID=2795739 RepID=A0ABS1WP60_9FLAO|nr:TIGR01777 family oxidoreductase [Olleya sediminilitoris]AXO79990.1 TIGR01777 family protein [Olleya aquimaris]MBL7560910.1 TIGR01777 family oxidoreductase [Olleya sediminilitoris]
MRILITGATGLIGTEIVKQCHNQNIDVNYLTTSKSKLSNADHYKGFLWNPSKNEIDEECLKDVEAIIHLVGASISKRWTEAYKKTIVLSRIQTSQLLFNTLKNTAHQVKHIVSASAIGIYPHSLTNYYTEDFNKVSTSFLGQVVKQWEQAVNAFSVLDIAVSKIRIGLVLSSKGGALPEMAKPIKFGAGAAFGSGKQWQSWIHVQDLSSLFLHVLTNRLEGIYNGVAPNPETNKELTKAIAKQLKRPLILPNIPRFAMRLVLGEMHILLFESQRVSSKKIEDTGFHFKHYNVQSALEEEY